MSEYQKTYDEYQRVTHDQNDGIPCPYCYSPQGHHSQCILLNRFIPQVGLVESFPDVIKAQSYSPESFSIPAITEGDTIRLLGMGVLWDRAENCRCNDGMDGL